MAPPPPFFRSIRLKYGIHTVFMFVNPNEPFSAVTKELFELLRDRYPDGLSAIVDDPKKLPVPSEEEETDYVIDYGVPVNPLDLSEGWTDLDVSDGTDAVGNSDIQEGATLAFMIRGVNDPKHDFIVESALPLMGDEDEEGDDTLMAVDDEDEVDMR